MRKMVGGGLRKFVVVMLAVSLILGGNVMRADASENSVAGFRMSVPAAEYEGDYTMSYDVARLEVYPGMSFGLEVKLVKSDGTLEFVNVAGGNLAENTILTYDESANKFYVKSGTQPGTYDIGYTNDVQGVSGTISVTVRALSVEDLKMIYLDEYSSYWKIEEGTAENQTNTFLREEGSTMKMNIMAAYDLDGQEIQVKSNSFSGGMVWRSSNTDVAAIDSSTGVVTFKGEGFTDITCEFQNLSKTVRIFVKRPGTYITMYADSSQAVIGNEWYEEWTSASHDGVFILDEETTQKLDAKGLLGIIGRNGFEPQKGLNSLYNLKGTGGNAPLVLRCKELAGMTLTGEIVAPVNCTHNYYLGQACDCNKNDANLKDITLTKADGTVETTKHIPYSLEILDNTAANNMMLLEKVERAYDSGKDIDYAQKAFLGGLMYQIQNQKSSVDVLGKPSEINVPSFSKEELVKINSVLKKILKQEITINVADGVEVDNLALCAKVIKYDEAETTVHVLEQTLNFTKEEEKSSETTQNMISENEQIIKTYDLGMTRQVAKQQEETITETDVPLQVTVDLGEDLSGQEVKVIREHASDNGKTEINVLPATVNGSKVTFESDKYSAYTFVKTAKTSSETGNDKVKPGTGSTGNEKKDSQKNIGVKTGDNTYAVFWMMLLAVAGITVYITTNKKKAKDKK